MSKTLALIPARAGSKRIPGKNYRLLLGKPLIQWTLEFAKSYHGFSDVLVSTDCEYVAEVASTCGLPPPWIRPVTLAGDHATTLDVVLHALDACEQRGQFFERLALLQPTSPIRCASRWDEAHGYLDAGAKAAVGVSAVEQHPYWTYWLKPDGEMNACFPGMPVARSQDLPTAAALNGALYLIDVKTLREARTFLPTGVRGVLMTDPLENIDIDNEADWQAAENKMQSYLENL